MLKNGGVRRMQSLIAPSVYLDHLGYMTFAQNRGLADRFRAALAARGGTLVLSWVNVAEYATCSRETAEAAEQFVEPILPGVFFLNGNPFEVASREPHGEAHKDFPLFDEFAKLVAGSTKPFTARGLFTAMAGQGRASFDSWSQKFVTAATALRAKYTSSKEAAEQVEKDFRSSGPETASKIVLDELILAFIRDKQSEIESNDARDLFHAVVPSVYCNYLLLDKYWEAQMQTVRGRLKRAGIEIELAHVFSPKANGINRFLTALEG